MKMKNLTKTTLFKTIVGSHMWGMQRAGSDIDYFTAFVYPTKVFLMGYQPKMSYFIHGETKDEHLHEIGKVVQQLLKGNLNFVLGVMSPVVVETSVYHKELRKILEQHPPRNIYYSVHGMATHGYIKYVEKGLDPSEHRLNKILRVLQFGITLLRTGKYEFKPQYGATPELIKEKIVELEKAYHESRLEDTIPEQILRRFLYRVRMDFLS